MVVFRNGMSSQPMSLADTTFITWSCSGETHGWKAVCPNWDSQAKRLSASARRGTSGIRIPDDPQLLRRLSTIRTLFPQHKMCGSQQFPRRYRVLSLQRKSNLPAGESGLLPSSRIGNETRSRQLETDGSGETLTTRKNGGVKEMRVTLAGPE